MAQNNENLKKMAAAWNCHEMSDFSFRPFVLEAGECRSYPTALNAVIFPTAGTGTFQLDHLTFCLKRGKCLSACPGRHLTIKNQGADAFEYTVLYYAGKAQPVFEADLKNCEELLELLGQLLAFSGSALLADAWRRESLLEQFFELLFQDIQPAPISTDEDLLESALAYIHENYAQKITLASLAAQVGTAENHLSYLFKKHLNIRPIDYLIDYRIRQAIHLLKQPDSPPVSRIARQVGYADADYFSRIFKKRMGFAPGRIRSR